MSADEILSQAGGKAGQLQEQANSGPLTKKSERRARNMGTIVLTAVAKGLFPLGSGVRQGPN